MRLSKIKLAGFKSFVDPTTLLLPSNLVGVVGPNGCGKSNIIDAVRWVMGESSPRVLRGDAMSDVIFSGSRTRKPVGMASVELVFDNRHGRIGGEFAKFSEISAKRSLGRDGVSEYRLNGTRCRRRDITNLFLGTGIGPRSYAIIEQGMISRLVEAKPEELRVYLEEAAGITVYKERRRETQSRIRRTQENLERLEDLRQEVGKQLAHLKRQAAAAERYKKLRAERRSAWATQQASRLYDLQQVARAGEQEIQAAQILVEKSQAAVRQAEAGIERVRLQRSEAQELLNGVQESAYQTASAISRTEQSLQHAQNTASKSRREIAEIETQLRDLDQHAGSDAEKATALAEQIAALEPAREAAQTHLGQSESVLSDAEQALTAWRGEEHEFQDRVAATRRDREVEQVRYEQFQRRIGDVAQRESQVAAELEAATPAPVQKALVEAEAVYADAATSLRNAEQQLDRVSSQYAGLRAKLAKHREQLEAARGTLRELGARQATLDALQQTAFGAHETKARVGPVEWLQSAGVQGERLAQAITVSGGWEKAVEAVLGHWLTAVLVDDPARFLAQGATLEQGRVDLLCGRGQSRQEDPQHLSHFVRGPAVLDALLGHVQIAESAHAAGELLQSLPATASVVLKSGEWVSRECLQLTGPGGVATGVLVREQEIRRIRSQHQRQEKIVAAKSAAVEDDERRLTALAEQRETAQAAVTAAQKEEGRGQAALAQAREKLQSVLDRVQELETLRQQLDAQRVAETHHVEQAGARIAELGVLLQGLEEEGRERADANRRLEGYRDAAHRSSADARQQMQELEVLLQTRRAEARSQQTNMQRLAAQRQQQNLRLQRLQAEVVDAESPLPGLRAELETQLGEKKRLEKALVAARERLEAADQAVAAGEQQRAQGERELEQARAKLEQLRLSYQESMLQADNVAEVLREAGEQPEQLLADLPEPRKVDYAQQIETLDRKIQRLEPVNLAAIEEHQAQAERQSYLDGQRQDLIDALDTLHQAIHKIDKGTRKRFKATFDQVNAGFGKLFPKLFGGGQAFLELTSDDLLTAGVNIMVQPPGKRVSNISLLSGGEKALTAVALVFSIFHLNPAPFCLLDEVDAPLDEANVGRFSELVREISEKVQILFVSHNKTTMEIAHQLTGVTMVEPGVSRLVSVDVLEAVAG